MARALIAFLMLIGIAGQAAAAAGNPALGNSVRAGLAGGAFELESDDGDAEADLAGADFRAVFAINKNIFLRGQYLLTEADEIEIEGEDFDADLEVNVLRLGAGYGGQVGSIRMYGVAEYIDVGLEIEGEDAGDDGYGITGGISDLGASNFIWNLELSFFDIADISGAGLDGMIGYRFAPAFAGFLGIQSYAFEDDFDDELSAAVLTIGGQFRF